MKPSLIWDDQILKLSALENRRLGQWQAICPPEGLPGDPRSGNLALALNYVLVYLNLAPAGHLCPVLTRGYPNELLARVQDLGGRVVAPVAPVEIDAISDRAKHRYSPGADGDGLYEHCVTWLPKADLRRINSDHRKRWILLPGSEFRMKLPSGELMGGAHLLVETADQSWRSFMTEPDLREYDELLPAGPIPPDAVLCGGDTGPIDRKNQATILISRELHIRHHQSRYMLLQSMFSRDAPEQSKIGVVARVETIDTPLSSGIIFADQSVRMATGTEIGEHFVALPVSLQHQPWLDAILGEPLYVTARVQFADNLARERDVCLLDELILEMLGVQSGDEVVIEGFPDENGVVEPIRAKAFRITDYVRQRRENIHGGDFSSRVPSARDALGQYSDLPWIFMTDRLRSLVGLTIGGKHKLGGQRMATVRIRGSRRYQLKKELRELTLVLSVAFVGIMSLADGLLFIVGGLAVLSAFVFTLVTVRLRGRMTRRVSAGIH